MRAIVALLKYFVGATFLICTIGLAFTIGAALVGFLIGDTGSLFGGMTILISIAAFIVLVLYVGMVALLISGHDRLCELTSLVDERNQLLRARPPAAD
jgi:hypothetical protein